MVLLKAWDSIRVYENDIKVYKIAQTQIFIPVIFFFG